MKSRDPIEVFMDADGCEKSSKTIVNVKEGC